MKLITPLLLLLITLCFVSCESENEVDLNIECPCIFKNEQLPHYKSCEQAGEDEERWECMKEQLLKTIYQDLRYSESARANCIEGTVVVGFLINEKGEIWKTDIRNDTLLGHGLEEEAINVIKRTNGNWCPGLINCEPVEMEYVIPIKYKLAK